MEVSIPEKKIQELLNLVNAVMGRQVATVSTLLTLAGKMGFAAGAVPQLKPFTNPLWAVTAGRTTNQLVHVKRIVAALTCLRAFLTRVKGAWVHIHRAIPISDEILCFVVDASPWGIGG
eukprot:6468506-Amphidinium_carterae.1